MRKNKKLVMLIAVFLGMIIMSSVPATSAASTQWYPTAGTVLEYDISSIVFLKNGTWIESTTYDIFLDQFGDYQAVPTQLKYYFPENVAAIPGYTLYRANTTLKFRHHYSENDTATLKRTMSFVCDNGSVADKHLYIYFYQDDSWYRKQTLGENIYYLTKNSFFYTQTLTFHDHLNCSAGPGDVSLDLGGGFKITVDFVFGDSMTYSIDFGTQYRIYITDRNGKLKEMSFTTYNLAEFDARGISMSTLTMTSTEYSGSAIPTFPLLLTFMGCLIAALLIKFAPKRNQIN